MTIMEFLETISKIALATVGTWRLSRTVRVAFDDGAAANYGGSSGLSRLRPEDILAHRVMDALCWIGIWMSAQTALWVACGFAGVLLNWLALCGAAKVARRSQQTEVEAAPADMRTSTKDCNGAVQLCL